MKLHFSNTKTIYKHARTQEKLNAWLCVEAIVERNIYIYRTWNYAWFMMSKHIDPWTHKRYCIEPQHTRIYVCTDKTPYYGIALSVHTAKSISASNRSVCYRYVAFFCKHLNVDSNNDAHTFTHLFENTHFLLPDKRSCVRRTHMVWLYPYSNMQFLGCFLRATLHTTAVVFIVSMFVCLIYSSRHVLCVCCCDLWTIHLAEYSAWWSRAPSSSASSYIL